MEDWRVDAASKGPRISSGNNNNKNGSSAAEVVVDGDGDVVTTAQQQPAAITVPIDQATVNSVLSEFLVMGLYGRGATSQTISNGAYDKMTVAVFCGSETMLPCPTVDLMKQHEMVARVIPIYECSNLNDVGQLDQQDGKDEDDNVLPNKALFECEKLITQQLKDETKLGKSKIRTIIVDPNASYDMGQIIHKIFSKPARRQAILTQPELLVIAPALLDDEHWQRNLLDRFRKDLTPVEPVHLVEVHYTKFMDGDSKKENNKTGLVPGATRKKSILRMGFVSSGDKDLIEHARELNDKIETKQGGPSMWTTDVKTIHGGRYRTQYGFTPANFYLPTDYDQAGPLKQWMAQEPIGRQTLYQMEVQGTYVVGDRVNVNYKGEGDLFKGKISNIHGDGTYDVLYDDNEKELGVMPFFIHLLSHGGKLPADRYSELSSTQIAETMSKALQETVLGEGKDPTITTIDNIGGGEGSVFVALWDSGNLMVVWDGRRHVDFNLFTYDENEEIHKSFEATVSKEIKYLKTTLSDKQPRGFGRVVNFCNDVYVDESLLNAESGSGDIHIYDDGNDDDDDDDDDRVRWIPHWSKHLFSLGATTQVN